MCWRRSIYSNKLWPINWGSSKKAFSCFDVKVFIHHAENGKSDSPEIEFQWNENRYMLFNPLSAVGNYTVHGPFYSPGPQGGYLGGSRPMLPCVTLCPLIT